MSPFMKAALCLSALIALQPDQTFAQTSKRYVFEYDGAGNLIAIVDTSVVPPSAPTGLAAAATGIDTIRLSWTDTSNNERAFVVERSATTSGAYVSIASVGANVTVYADSGLEAGTTYFYRVRARGDGGASAYSNEASATTSPPGAPAAPGLLSAVTVFANQVDLSWVDASDNETGFTLERRAETSGAFVAFARVGANVSGYSDTGLAPNTIYHYRVLANGVGGDSPYSNQASVTTSSSQSPTAPAGLAVRASGIALQLTWVNRATGISGNRIERKAGATGTYAQIASVTGTLATYTDQTVQPGVTYSYRVRTSLTAGGFTPYSNEASGAQPASVAPTGLAVSASGLALRLAWVNSATGISGNKIERRVGSTGTYAEIASVTGTLATYTDQTVPPGVTYFYRVRAFLTAGAYSPYSNEVSGAQPAGVAPTGLAVSASGLALRLAWVNRATGISGNRIERRAGATGTYAQIASVTGTLATYTDQTVQPGVTYSYRVRAFLTAGAYSPYSNEASGAQPASVAPTGLAVSASGLALKLAWVNSATGISGNRIERRAGATGTYAEIASVLGTLATYTDQTVQPGVTYFYRVRSYLTAGAYSPYSNEASGTQPASVAPSGLTVDSIFTVTGGLLLNWTNNAPGATGVKIERKTGETGSYAQIATVGAATATYTDLTSVPYVTYFYRVRAYTAAGGNTAYSNEADGYALKVLY